MRTLTIYCLWGRLMSALSLPLRKSQPIRIRTLRTTLRLALLLPSISQARAQIIVTPATVPTPSIQLSNSCVDYGNAVSAGVLLDGAHRPGACVASELVPLFNGQALDTDWRALMNGPNPPKFKETRTSGRQTCIVATGLTVDLSARVQRSQLNWAPTLSDPPTCANEKVRINTIGVSGQTLQADAEAVLNRARSALQQHQNSISVCGTTGSAAQDALKQSIWTELKAIARLEQVGWQDPETKLPNQCAPQCGLCAPGWVGTIVCQKTVRDTDPKTDYSWDETQTWTIGGSPLPGGPGTHYPAAYSATGHGRKKNPNGGYYLYTVNAAWSSYLQVVGTQQTPTFSMPSTYAIPGGVVSNQSPPNDKFGDSTFQIYPSFHLSPTTYIFPTTPGPYACGTVQTPGTAACVVTCTVKLAFQ